ncbi:unnamed protein product [Alopecurus aequalis]
MVRRRQRKSQQLRAASLLSSGGIASVKKEEEEAGHEGHLKPADVSGLRHALSGVKVKLEIDDDQSKPNLDGCKMVHVQKKPARRGRRVKYGKDSRYAYIMSIAHRMKLSPNRLVSGVEGRLFHDVFNHLIDAIVTSHTTGDSEKAIVVDIGSDGCNSLVPLVNRECLLKKILTLLLCMARRRHYNPPSDNEILCYRVLKRHIRCMVAYHEAKGGSEDVQWEYSKDPAGYHSLSCSQTISAVEELIGLTGSLANALSQFPEFSQNNDVLMDDGNEDDFYPLGPLMFTAGFFDGRLVEYMKQLRRSCLNLMLGIMGKLEPDGQPVTLFPVDDNNIMLEWLKQVKFNRPRNSADDVHQSVLLARYAASLIQGISSSVEDACAELTDMLRRRQHCYEFANRTSGSSSVAAFRLRCI